MQIIGYVNIGLQMEWRQLESIICFCSHLDAYLGKFHGW